MKNSELDNQIEEVYVADFHFFCVIAEKIVGNMEEAEDIVSDVFLKIWENREQLQIHQSLKGYLIQSIYNSCCNYLKRKLALRKYIRLASENIEVYEEHDPLSILISKEELEKMKQEIEDLPAKCKRIFLLVKFDEMSNQDVAKMLNISVNTVNKQMNIAKDKLRVSLAKKKIEKKVIWVSLFFLLGLSYM